MFDLIIIIDSGSCMDVDSLKDFFENKLKYHVKIPPGEDMTKTSLVDYFRKIEKDYLTEKSEDYHSFICVVMSHGNKVL